MVLAALPIATAALAATGWLIGDPRLASLGGPATMKMNAAIGLIATGAALILLLTGRRGRLSLNLALVGAAIGGVTLVEHLVGLDLGVDHLLHPGQGGAPPGRMAFGTSLCLTLLGLGLALAHFDGRTPSARVAAVAVLTAAAVLAAVAGAAALWNQARLYGAAALAPVFTAVPPHAAVAMLAISLCGVFALTLGAQLSQLQAVARLTGEVADREARLRVALDAAGMGDWRWDAAGDRLSLSPSAATVFGVEAGTTSWTELQALVHSEDRERVQKTIRAALVSGASFEVEYRLLRPADRREVTVLAAGRGVYDHDGRPVGTLGVVADITQQKQAQEGEKQLAREIDHRARNVLALVQAIVKLTPADDPRAYRSAVSLRVNALARAHTMLAEARWNHVPLDSLLRRELTPYAGEQLRLRGPPVELTPAAVQPFTLLLQELTASAVARVAFPDPPVVVWRVLGGGALSVGWDEPAARTDAADPDRFRPALVEGLLRQIEARLDRKPRGAVVRLRVCLPPTLFVRRRRAELATHDVETAGPSRQLGGLRVLVLEDEPLLALEMRQTLEGAGAAVLGPACSVAQATSLLREAALDFAVLDVNVGGQSSVPVAAELKRRRVPFLFVTGYQKPEVVPGRALQKPVAADALLAAVGEELRRAG